MGDFRNVWLHKKTGREYVVEGVCTLEHSNKPAYLYRSYQEGGDDGVLWARDKEEFLDGRFELLDVHPESEVCDGN